MGDQTSKIGGSTCDETLVEQHLGSTDVRPGIVSYKTARDSYSSNQRQLSGTNYMGYSFMWLKCILQEKNKYSVLVIVSYNIQLS